VGDHEAGRAVPCRRCHHVNVVPSARVAPVAAALPPPPAASNSRAIWLAVGVAAFAVAGWAAWSAVGSRDANAAPAKTAATPAEALQQELLRKNVGHPGDPILNQMYAEMSARYFSGALPALQVLWEPRLADVGKLAAQAFTLQGMFGHVGLHSVILLNPELQADRKAIARALSHEIVHAYLYATGDKRTDHGPAFQTVLRRLSTEGAFEGVVAGDEERRALRAWLEAESARLDFERGELERLGADLERERVEVQRGLEEFNGRVSVARAQGREGPAESESAAITARRDGYNQRAADANERAERDRADLEHFNREVARYNLMLVYPDGLDEGELLRPKAPVARPGR
jgi:predicted SprT family Zn-dependent metalloprotease